MIVAVIPARYNSTRYPGKALVRINKKPIIQYIYENVKKFKCLDDVIIATGHDEIIKSCNSFNAKSVKTQKSHLNGTSRCLEAVQKTYPLFNKDSIVINIQGDQLFIKEKQISDIVLSFKKNKNTQIATLKKKITNMQEVISEDIVKVETDSDNKALDFYRKQKKAKKRPFFKHIGVYAFKYKILKEACSFLPTKKEINLSLEQIRWLENRIPITVLETEYNSISLDTKEDLKKIKNRV